MKVGKEILDGARRLTGLSVQFFVVGHIHMSYFGATGTPLFWISGFQSQSGFCLIHIAEAMRDSPVVLLIANLLTVSTTGHRPSSYLAQGYYWHRRDSNPQS